MEGRHEMFSHQYCSLPVCEDMVAPSMFGISQLPFSFRAA